MKRLQVVFIIAAAILLSTSQPYAQFYYSSGRQNILNVDSSKVCLKFDPTASQQDQENIIASIDRIISFLVDEHEIDEFKVCTLATSENYESFLDSIQEIEGIYLVEPFYHNNLDSVFLVGDRFCVAFNQSLQQSEIDSINAIYKVETDYEIEGMPNVFVLRNTDSSGYRMLGLANMYYLLSDTYYSHPIFGVWIQTNSYKLFDYYNEYQFHTKKVIGDFNLAAVWDYAGLNQTITVAVIDDGVTSHEDLPAVRVLPGYDFAHGDSNPQPGPAESHGLGCAGIIAATHTTDSVAGLSPNSGVISLNPNVEILPVKIFKDNGSGSGVTVASIAAAISFAWKNGADVLSNSWGYGFSCPAPLGYGFDVLTAAVDSAAEFGRGGAGCPVIFASGNGNPFIAGVLYPACLSSTFSVGATQLNDVRWTYSSFGAGLDIIAPSGNICLQGDVWTLDQMNSAGYNTSRTVACGLSVTWDCPSVASNDIDYDCNFGGTSAAAPIVSGVASLIISKDSNLTAQEVYDILKLSAVTDLDWGTITPPNNQYGFGRVDAFRAILSISRGDLNNDNDIATVLDLTYLIDRIYRGGADPFPSPLMGDLNCDGSANNIVDLTYLVDFIFRGSGLPPINPCYEF